MTIERPVAPTPARPIAVRPAAVAEHAELEALQRRASLANAGDREALLAHPEAIGFPVEQITRGDVFVASVAGRIMGFAAVLARDDGDAELDALFVEPAAWRLGVGRALIEHCAHTACARGAKALHVIGNPHAQACYLACGFEEYGRTSMQFGIGLLMRRALR